MSQNPPRHDSVGSTQNGGLNRRSVLRGGGAVAALALVGRSGAVEAATRAGDGVAAPVDPSAYGAMPSERFPIPAVDLSQVDPMYVRHLVDHDTGERPGTIVVDTGHRVLYLTLGEGRALRYGVGIGRAGFAWSGRAVVAWKREWPTWTPPAEMIEREPELEQWRNGMPPGLENPLGARALYIFDDGVDTLYRLHGTMEARSIGKAVSSGCVRLLNQDVIDLYARVPTPVPILVV